MECILGTHIVELSRMELEKRAACHREILIDLGTGDGRFVLAEAKKDRETLAIGLDACRENLRASGSKAPDNALFTIANALQVPQELHGLATLVTVNFPWGSLLEALLANPGALLGNLLRNDAKHAGITLHLNEGALAEQGVQLEEGAQTVWDGLQRAGYRLKPWRSLDADDFKTLSNHLGQTAGFWARSAGSFDFYS